MKRVFLLSSIAAALLLAPLVLAAQELGYWRAASNTAKSITGDVSLAEEKLTINFYTVTMSRIRDMNAGEISAVFDTDSNAGGSGGLYRLGIPAAKTFLHKNKLCGTEDVQWMVAYASGNTLQLAFLSGAKPPVFTLEAIQNSTDLCGTFSYVR